MKYSKRIALLLALVMVAALSFGCAQPGVIAPTEAPVSTEAPTATAAPTPESTAITVMDMAGREVTLDAPAEKIVALTAADCEILYAIGAGDKLVGRGEYCNYPEAVLSVPSVQSGNETNIEQIIALQPQLVILSIMAQTKEQVGALEAAGIKVFASDAQNIEGVYEGIALIGQLVGKSAEAEAVVEQMKASFADIAAKVTGNGEKTVYFEVSPLQYGLWTAGKGTFMDEIATMLGLKNAFADVTGWGEVSEEQVIERDPDYIVTVAMYFGEGYTPVEEILSRKGWENMQAIKNDAVYNADSNEISFPGPRLVNAAEALYTFVYGG
jgi:iron complex transport system substrate-binding protein